MCGIIGYRGHRDASEVLVNGLKRLEYRGYDSWGMATLGKEISLVKKVGKISEYEAEGNGSHAGIAHTRWATHGEVNEKNAHPHFSCDKRVAIVHNGIIENYQQLRKELSEAGHGLASDTDSEVITHLIEDNMKSMCFRDAVRAAVKRLRGSYAVVAICAGQDEMVAVRKDSPLVVGIGENEHFAASDVPAFREYTNKVVFLGDNEMAVFNGSLEFYEVGSGNRLEKEVEEVDWTAEQATKGEFDHFMIKEISEQHESIMRALAHDDESIMKMADRINSAFGVFFVACGSSYHAALTASYTFSRITKKHINVVLASEFPYYKDFLTDKTLMVPISQSGETADVMAAVKVAKKGGAKVLSIVNVMGSSLHRASDYSLLMNAGPEICVLSTKTYTSQLTILIMLAYACAGRLKEGRGLLERAAEASKDLTSQRMQDELRELAGLLKAKEHIFMIGRGRNYPTALEAALKVKEVSYIHAEGFAGGELKHGSIALIEKGTPCIVIAPKDETYGETISNAMEVKSRGGFIIGISPRRNEAFDYHIRVPELGGSSAIVDIIPVQVLAYYLAVLRGCEVDTPKNLAKSVTVK